MRLPVLPNPTAPTPWYADGLAFTCQQCGNCCTGGPGYVWLSDEEVLRLATHLKLTVKQTLKKHCRSIGGRISLKEHRNSAGQYDCEFLVEQKIRDDQGVTHTRRGCGIYPVRPLQCRTWPFWDGNLRSPQAWKRAAQRCHGMAAGGRKFSAEQIETLRTATDWPQRPPTSAPSATSPAPRPKTSAPSAATSAPRPKTSAPSTATSATRPTTSAPSATSSAPRSSTRAARAR